MKKILILILILLACSCTVPNNKQYTKEKTFLGYVSDVNNDMVLLLNTEVYITTVNNENKNVLINEALTNITNLHMLLDSHHKYLDNSNNIINNIAILNESIGKEPLLVDPIVIDALKEAIKLTKLTKGYFNITLGELSNLYNDKFLPYDSTNIDPNKASIDKAINGIIPYESIEEYIIIDEVNNTVQLKENKEPYSLDLGAFSKGYILNKVYEILKKHDTSFLLNAGSSSIVTYTNDNENISWTISIKNPDNNEDELILFSLNDGAISTSGDYEQYYYLKDGTKRHHILNPYTGYSENFYQSNTLISNNAGVVDALSTALFNVDDQNEFTSIINNINKEYKDDISFLLIKNGLNIFMNNSFKEKLTSPIPINNSYSVTTTIIE